MLGNRDAVDILIVEDDDDDYFLIKEAMEKAGLVNPVQRVETGDELISFLVDNRREKNPTFDPGLILLDLNLPGKCGHEALAEIKSDMTLRKIPIIVFTTSDAEADISRAYDFGGNSFVQKPFRFDQMVEFFSVMGRYWFHFSKLPLRNKTVFGVECGG